MAVLPDVITQLVMLSEGHRSSFDVGETLQAAQMGVIGGLVGAGLFKFGGNLFGRLGEDFAGSLARAAIHGALTNVGTNMVAGTVDAAENQIHAALDPQYAKLLQEQLQDQGYADQKSGQNPLIAALNGAFTGALFHTASEASFDLAGETFGASDALLTVDGQPRKFTALPAGDGTGGSYALFDQSHSYVGRGTVDDTGTMTVTPNHGTPYTGTVVTPHDNATSTELNAEPPPDQPPQDQPAAAS